MKKRIFFLAVFSVFLQITVLGNPVYWNVNVQSGLSDSFVKDILRDQFGFMWFATNNGLDRYDGYQFRKYTTIPLGNLNDDIESICEDAMGTIWVLSVNGIYAYDCVKDQVFEDVADRLATLGITEPITWLCTDDHLNLWALSRHRIFFYDFSGKKLSVIDNLSETSIIRVTSYGGEAYALAENGDFFRVDMRSCKLMYENSIYMPDTFWRMIYLDTQGRLWFYIKHYPDNCLHCYSVREKKWSASTVLEPLSKMILTSLTDDGKGSIWIGTENDGVYIYSTNVGGEDFRRLDCREGTGRLPSNHISSLYKDSRNTMWIGTSKRGAVYMDLTDPLFSVKRFSGKEDVSCIVDDREGNLWVGFDGSGLLRIDSNGHETLFNQKNGSLPTDIVTCSLVDRSGRLWIGTFGHGVFYKEGQRFVPFSCGDVKQQLFITCMTEDSDGNLWFGSIYQGLSCYQRDGGERLFTTDNSILKTNSINCLYSDNSGHLYIGSSTGFYILDVKTGSFMKRKGCLLPLADTFVTSLYKDRRGLVWIGTRVELIVYDEYRDTLYRLTQKDGLSNPYVRTVTEDNAKNVWVSTDNGLTCVSVKKSGVSSWSFVCTPYFEEDGLQNSMFSSNVTCHTRKGDCLIGSTNGYLCILQNRSQPSYPPVKIIFTSLYFGERQVIVGDDTGVLDRGIQQTDGIVLDYDQNNLVLTVSAMNYTRKHKIHYLYRLKETQKRWVLLDGNRINFNALAPGSYTLEVKASDLGGWTSDVSVLRIRVRPPFWLSLPAFAFYFLLVVAAVFMYVRRMMRKHQETLAVQKLELELEQQHRLEENKIRFFTNVSHDLKTPLSLIITPLEKILSGNLETKLRMELELVWRNACLLMDGVTQLLDFRKIDVGTEKLQLSHGDFVEFLRKTVDSFRHYSQGRGIHLSLRINAQSLEMNFDQNKMRRIVTNLLSNAFKYNKENGSVVVTVGRTVAGDGYPQMRLEVADTGIGIKEASKERVFDRFYQEEGNTEYVGSGIGLHIVKEYVAMHHGDVFVEDNHPQGSVFVVTIPMDLPVMTDAQAEAPLQEENKSVESHDMEDRCNGVTILVVEDNLDFRMFLERCLNEQYRVLLAANGVEALGILKRHDVDIVISDVMMPEMNGLELCNRIKTDVCFSHIPVILLTAKSTEANIISGLKDGADDYITKPFNLSILRLRIQKILDWTRNNHRRFTGTMDISPSEITVSSLDEQLIQKAIEIVEKNMGDSEFSVEDFGMAIGMTRGHLYKKLMTITGKSPLEFIRILRIKRGRSLLEQGRTNISEVAYTVGFSPKQFSKYFKEEYGYLPSEFVRKND